jgi:hypothetical protein
MASTAAEIAGSLTHTPHTQCFISQLELAVSSTGILERIKNFTIPKSFIQLPSSDVFEKGNYYFVFYNNYLCLKSLYAHDMAICFLQDFLIPFLCDPDLQCRQGILLDPPPLFCSWTIALNNYWGTMCL